MRLLAVASVVYMMIVASSIAYYSSSWNKNDTWELINKGIIPLVIVWGIVWVRKAPNIKSD